MRPGSRDLIGILSMKLGKIWKNYIRKAVWAFVILPIYSFFFCELYKSINQKLLLNILKEFKDIQSLVFWILT
jgi:hypothetical protein